jgi:hypothetical protein
MFASGELQEGHLYSEKNDYPRPSFPVMSGSIAVRCVLEEKEHIVNEIRYIASTLVGVGVERASLEEALKEHPHFIACDAGATDAGPFSLGSGQPAFAKRREELCLHTSNLTDHVR